LIPALATAPGAFDAEQVELVLDVAEDKTWSATA